jgi:uncharacterized protein (DUF2225 family)
MKALRSFWTSFKEFARRADKGQSAIVRHDPLTHLTSVIETVLGDKSDKHLRRENSQ